MSAPKPPVALKNHCSIIHDGIIYVYSPDAFQTLELKEGAQWQQVENGVAVEGAACVKGGVDGDNSKTALYVVGGAANASSSDYPGLQRFSISDKSWQTITPTVKVTQNRLNHGAVYMNASSSILVYAGSQVTGYDGLSSETFVLEMYPPYRVLAYSSIAPPTTKPIMLPWGEDRAFMAGGSSTNTDIFTFGPQDGWQNLGLSLPDPLPNSSVAQSAILTLDDNSRILQTFNLGQDVPNITSNVLLKAGGQLADFGETVGGSTPTPTPIPFTSSGSKAKRDVTLATYPSYNDSLAPSTSRTDFDLVQGDDGLVAFVGGSTDSVAFFNQTGDSWISTTSLLGKQQEPLSSPSSTQSTSTATSTPTSAPGSSSHKTNGLAILGGVLGGICGLAAILIIILLWLRSVRRKREKAEKQSGYGDDKKRSGEYNFEEQGLQPLARQGQPMGRSPVPSAVITEADSTAMVGNKSDPKYLIRRVSSERVQTPGYRGSGIGFGQALFKRDKNPLSISKPMNPILGDYQPRPSIELGRATPVGEPIAAAVAKPARKASQRKTDEGWGKYFQSDPQTGNRTMFFGGRSSGASRGKSGFWPGSGVPETSTRSTTARSTKIVLRDSHGNPLQAHTVMAGSPTLAHGPPDPQSRGLEVAEGIPARISRASSVMTDSDEDYEDERIDGAFSSGIPASVSDMPWTPVGNTWGGPAQRPLRPPSSYYQTQDMPLQTASSEETTGTQSSSIPSFPMPNSVRSMNPDGGSITTAEAPLVRVNGRTQEARDYFTHARARSGTPENNDMSWLNLGTPNR
ncbi:hypothetical protein PV08_02845 [Exophiala spinifera]|uniref:Pre-mRNA splicing factor CLF1 n=1 Tax=Exophiala spinifera TaxID=91928 RepID=A0A0D2A0S1_9EURO|nr:uncharacterized protein PV08_02845 [Exophiala spinifera]KIW18557.1 hypothetical protein PV08_02845 [Exophiala spinifera]